VAIQYNIKLLSPVIIRSEDGDMNVVNTLNYIPGSTILGALADAFIKKNNIKENAEQNSDFFKIFLSNDYIFSNAYFDLFGDFSTPIPLNFQKDKRANENKLHNIFVNIPQESKLKPVETYFGVLNGQNILWSDVKTKYNFHHSRDRLLGHSKDGSIFNYESIAEFQNFIGYITGKDEAKFMEFLKDIKELRLGLSKNSQYGNVKISFQSKSPSVFFPQSPETGLVLISDLILRNEKGYFITNIEEFEKELRNYFKDDNLKIKKSFVRYGKRKSYKKIYHAKEPEVTYLKKGSSFLLDFSSIPSRELVEKAFNYGLGEKINEGYGKLSFFDASFPSLSIMEGNKPAGSVPNINDNSMAKFLIANVYKKEAERKVISKAVEYAEQVSPIGNLSGNLLGRLSLAVSENKSFEAFKTNFLENLHSTAKTSLENSYISNETLKEFIEKVNIKEYLKKIEQDYLNEDFLNNLYKKFFLTFFRMLSKKVKSIKGVVNE